MTARTTRQAQDFAAIVERLGGAAHLEAEARETKAFRRAREVKSAVDMLQIVLGYCLGPEGLRLTAAWAEAIGLASISNVAVLKRVRGALPWLEVLVARMLLAARSPEFAPLPFTGGRPIRLVDATVVAKSDRAAREAGGVWRTHAVYELPAERFSAFEVTDESAGERLDRAAVVPGEIRIADRAYLQPDRIAIVLAAGADVIVRAPWNGARWLDADGDRLTVTSLLLKAKRGVDVIDRPIWMAGSGRTRIAVRLVALRKPPEAVAKSLEKVRQEAARRGRPAQPETVIAAEWLILITSLSKADFPAATIGDLYRLRWRIEVAFKHLKSGIGLTSPPGADPAMAKAHILCHLLANLLTEPLIAEQLGVSPRLAAA